MNDVVQTHGGRALEGVSSPVGFFVLSWQFYSGQGRVCFFFGFHPTEVTGGVVYGDQKVG